MQAITGVYLGWIPPNGSEWEPLFRTIRVAGGYETVPTRWYALRLAQYPGLELALSLNPNPLDLPYILSRRTPLNRPDYERNSRTLGLPYPKITYLAKNPLPKLLLRIKVFIPQFNNAQIY